jgi:glutathione S-transferase
MSRLGSLARCMAMALRLHEYAASANCYKVRLALAQLGIDYERVPVDIFAGETLTDAFARINPARTTPVLELEESSYLTESGAILLFLAEGTPLLPSDRLKRAQVARWLLFEQADVVPSVGGLRFRLATGRLAPDHERVGRARAASHEMLGVLDAHLRGRAFFVADRYSIADIAIYGYVHVAHEAGVGMEEHPEVARWLQRVAAQPGYMNDLEPYPANARPGVSRSIYD